MTQIQALNWLGIRSLKSRNSELKSPLLAMIQPGFVVAKFPNNPVNTSEGWDIRQPPQEARKSPEISASGGPTYLRRGGGHLPDQDFSQILEF